jgi:3-hydroxypropanoate dehydrogenase
MNSALNDQSLDRIFRSARTPAGWADRPVEDAAVREIYDLMKWGPTSANCSPARFVWVHSADGKATLAGYLRHWPRRSSVRVSAQSSP